MRDSFFVLQYWRPLLSAPLRRGLQLRTRLLATFKKPPPERGFLSFFFRSITLSLALEDLFFCSRQLRSRQALRRVHRDLFLREQNNRFAAFGLLLG